MVKCLVMKNIPIRFITLVLTLVILAGCSGEAPLVVYVTPTPQTVEGAPTASIEVVATALAAVPTVDADATQTAAVSSATATFTTTATATSTPTETPTTPPTATLPPPTPEPASPTPEPPTPVPNVTWRGPIVGPGYVLPATPQPPTVEGLQPTTPPAAETVIPIPTEVSPVPPTSEAPAVVMPNLDPNRLGVQLDINLSQEDWNDAMARIETLGVRWIKVQLPWRDMQPNGPDQRNEEFFRLVEQHLEDAARRNFNVLVSVVKAPPWARSVQTEDGPPDDPQHLANFISLVLNEINAGLARPVLGDYIDAVEIWNEPNLIREWQGTLPFNGQGYMRLFAPAYQAVRAYSPTIAVITAGLAPTGNSAGSVDDREFLRQMYAAGLAQYQDIYIGIHPYSWANSPDATCCGTRGWDDDPHFFFADNIRDYREIMNRNGHNVQMFITEFGYASWDGLPGNPPPGSEWMRFTDRFTQGLYTIRALEIAQSSGYIGPVILWNLNFGVLAGLIENRDERVAYSLVMPGTLGNIDPTSRDRTERPLFWMIYDAVRPDVQLPSF